MKKLSDGNEVSSRSYYYLLDFNEVNNHNLIHSMFDKVRLVDLTLEQYKQLFQTATNNEFEIEIELSSGPYEIHNRAVNC